MAGPFTLFNVTVALGVAVPFFWVLFKGSSAPLPPGPKKLPLIGNLLDMPTDHEWLKFAEWASRYGGHSTITFAFFFMSNPHYTGDLMSASVFGQQIIIVSSAKTAIEMLEKKSRIYSDRPVVHMSGELIGWKDTLALLPYGRRFRSYRKMFHQVIGTYDAMSRFHHIEELQTHHFLKRLLANPEELARNIRR